MYENYYKFTGKPFQLNPDPSFFFQSKGHQRAMAYLRYGIQQGQGFIVITGDVGTGKTMLVNNLFKELEAKSIVAAKIVSSNVRENDLLRLVAASFGLPFERSSKAALLKNLEEYFRSCADEGKRALLLVDEVQNLPRDSLEELRMLSNFDYDGQPLVQSFLLGQREFRTVMRAPGLEQLRQRVLAAYHLKPLSDKEVETYIKHRLAKVGWKDDPNIEPDVYFAVYRYTGGVPRRINTLFDRVLLNSSLDDSHAITVRDVELVAREFEQERSEGVEEDLDDETESAKPDLGPVTSKSESKRQALDDSMQEIRKVAARMDSMQRTIDNLSSQLEASTEQNARASKLWPQTDGLGRVAILSVSLGVGILGIGLAGAFVYRLLT